MRFIRAMERHRDDAQVQEKACGALCKLAANNANQVALLTHWRARRELVVLSQPRTRACLLLKSSLLIARSKRRTVESASERLGAGQTFDCWAVSDAAGRHSHYVELDR